MAQDPGDRGGDARKFWYPLSFGKVLLVFFIAQVVATIPVVVMREGLGWPIPQWIAGGVGGVLGVLGVRWLIVKQLAAGKAPPPSQE